MATLLSSIVGLQEQLLVDLPLTHNLDSLGMDEVKFYWIIFAAIASAAWIVTAFIRDRVSQSVTSSSMLIARLIENNKLNIENPEIQKFISQNALREEAYFRSGELLEDDLFYRAKTYVYRQLNLFDEILSISSKTRGGFLFLKPAALIEISDWEEYIKEKLRHPLYRSILNHEKHIFGVSLREFWAKNKVAIESTPADPFIW